MNTIECHFCHGLVGDGQQKYRHFKQCKEFEGKKEDIDYISCKLCGFRSTKLEGHLKGVHDGLTSIEYKQKFPDAKIVIDSIVSKRAAANQGKCVKPLELSSQSKVCLKCGQLYDKRKTNEHLALCIKAYPDKWMIGVDYVKCPICEKPFIVLNMHMKEEHRWTLEDFADAKKMGLKMICDSLNAVRSASNKEAYLKRQENGTDN
jgi:predicted transcriptional regulator